MKAGWYIAAGLVGVGTLGCRAATRVAEFPGVDLALEVGNRGYLMGTPPPVGADRNSTRQMVHTDVEIPSLYKPTHGKKVLQEIAPPEVDMADQSGGGTAPALGSFDTYTVKRGESLWSIAAKTYGRATHWRRIYDANRDQLKSPDQLHAGMVLKIPRDQSGHASPRNTETIFSK